MIRRPTIKIQNSELYMIFFFVLFYVPQKYAVSSHIYTIWRYSCVIVSIFLIVIFLGSQNKNNTVDKQLILIMLYYFWMNIGANFFSKNGEHHYIELIRNIGFCSYIIYCFKKNSKRSVTKAYIVAGLLISIIHLTSYFKYRNIIGGMRHGEVYEMQGGIYRATTQNWYYLSYDNDSIYYFLPIIVLLFYYATKYSRRVFVVYYTYMIIVLYTYISQLAATCIITMIFLLIFFGLYQISNTKTIFRFGLFTYKNSVIIGLLISILPVFSLGTRFTELVASFFGKSANLGRYRMWHGSILYIKQNLITGLGREPRSLLIRRIYQTHCHNLVLEHLYTGGIIGLFLFVLLLYSVRPLNSKGNNKGVVIFSVAIIAYFLVAGIDWLLSNPIPFSIFIFNYYLNSDSSVDSNLVNDGRINRLSYEGML